MAKVKTAEGTCYCGGTLASFHPPLDRCSECERFYVDGVLMIPWKGWKDSESGILCRRCSGKTNYDGYTMRYTCIDTLCAYEWRDTDRRYSPAESDIAKQQRVLKQLMRDDMEEGLDDKVLMWAKKSKEEQDKFNSLGMDVL